MTEHDARWQKLKDILADALEAPPEERAALLDRRCGDDVELRAELEAVIAADTATHLLDQPLPLVAGEDLSSSPFPTLGPNAGGDDPLIGGSIGRYRLLRCIGAGGMGRVYEAEQEDHELKRKVAVKLIKSGVSSELLVKRFHRERQALALQTHPNIARLFDVGATEDGSPYLVMEYVDGKPIDRYCDEHRLTVRQRLALFRKVCAAVSSAHRNLIIHRDLKPSNILVDGEGEPKLLDFGIAKSLEPQSDEGETVLTAPAARFLTPEYASPEQIAGKPLTTAADVYSLGVLLYSLLTGRLPIRFQHTDSPLAWEKNALQTRPEKPSAAIGHDEASRSRADRRGGVSPEKLSRSLKGDLDNIVTMALKKEPERRYEAVRLLDEDIDRHLRGLPVMARPDTVGYLLGKFVRRNRLAVTAAALVLTILVAAVIGVSGQARKARAEADKARTVVEFLKEMVASPNPYDGEGKDVTVAETLDRAVETIEPRFRDRPDIAAELHSAIGATYFSLGRYEAAKAQFQSALDLLRQVHQPPHADIAAGLKELGVTHQYLGDYEQADRLLGEAVAMFDQLGDEGAYYANALNEYAMVCQEVGDYARAGRYFERARDLFVKIHGAEHEDVVTLTANLAVNAHYLGDLDQAETLYGQVLDDLRARYGENHLDRAYTFGNLAQVLVERGDYERAESLLNQSLAIKRELLGDSHAAVGLDYHNLGGVAYMRKAYDTAAGYLEQALAVYERAYPDPHVRVGQSHLLKGNAYIGQERFEKAEDAVRQAMNIFGETLPADHDLNAFAQDALGASLTGLGRFEEAERNLLASFAALRDKPAVKRKYLTTLENLVRLYEAWQRDQEAAAYRALLEKAEGAEPSQP